MLRSLANSVISRGLATDATKAVGPVQQMIRSKLQDKFGYQLIETDIKNVSWKHDQPKGAETHFEVTVVSTAFETVKMEERIKTLEALFGKEKKSIKSLTFKALTPSKWFDSNQRGLKLDEVFCAPPVQGGRLKEVIKSSPFYQELDKQQPPQ